MKTRLLIMCCLLATSAMAADVTGKWTAQVPGRGGNMREMTMNLKADGAALTGTVSTGMGETDISGGKVDGDNIAFSVVREFQGNSMTIHYAGQVSGDEIHFKSSIEGREGSAREFTAKRAAQ